MNYGYEYGIKIHTFVKKKDTMNIKCYCGQEYNLYIKNLEFKKGNYELNFDYGRKYNQQTKKYERVENIVSGSQIKTPKEIQNILFKNIYVPRDKATRQDFLFKDIKFTVIDIKDTLNVKLKEIEKINIP
jgi:hypothetical protein